MKLNPKEIKEKYPKSVEKLKEYLSNGYKDMNVSEEVKAQIKPEELASYAIFGTRGLYSFFDVHEIFVFVGRSDDKFGFGIGDFKHGLNDGQWFEERLDAEKSAFETAFEELEKRLSND